MKAQKKPETKQNFVRFLLDKEQYYDWLLLLIVCITGYCIVKSGYPYPLTYPDSGGYIMAAQTDTFFFYRPFGYSMFLQIIHAVSSNIHAVFIGQIGLYFISAAIFAFTIKYFFTPAGKTGWYLLLFFFVFSPMAFILANCVMSDLLFGAVIFILLSSFIFIIKGGKWVSLVVFSLALFCSLHVRYSAMVFPVVTVVFFFLIKGKMRWLAIASSLAVTLVFHTQLKDMMQETTGFRQFSTGFDGWQYANNGMHVLPYIKDVPDRKLPKRKEIRELHRFIMSHKDIISEKTNQGKAVTTAFMWENDLPLKMFLQKKIREQRRSYSYMWIKLGSTTYKDYGQYLILNYPWEFMRHYYFPNLAGVFHLNAPGIMYGEKTIDSQEAYDWYQLDRSQDLSCKNPFYQGFVWTFMQITYGLTWIFILALSVWATVWRKRLRFDGTDKIVFWGLFVFGVIYYASTVFASPIESRYLFPMECIHFAFCYILFNKLTTGIKNYSSLVKSL
ncbi:MAG: hypothetical protein LBP72_10240 [Dysgonamonadaceae bacterium]|jgi:ABC-type multidrug transport system fused ATPase/permease subunit|nr:hypothetical protein [Dysgonamonadaceae bacterium]